MLLVVCVDLDDDIGRKTDWETPIVGSDQVREAAVDLATADPEDSDVNVLFQGLHVTESLNEPAEVVAVAGIEGSDVRANRRVGDEIDEVLAALDTGEQVRALVITDGAQDESVLPVIRSRVPIDGVRRVVVRQAQDLESMYYTIKQVLDDPETRGALLVPLGILLLIYPLAVLASLFDLPGSIVLGLVSGLFGVYLIGRGIGIGGLIDETAKRTRRSLYAGRVTIVTYLVAAVLLVVGGLDAVDQLDQAQGTTVNSLGIGETLAALAYGAVQWFAAAGVTTSLGQITDEYLSGSLRWRYLNAPVYVVAIALVVHGVSGFVIDEAGLSYLAAMLAGGTVLGLVSTLVFAVAESRFPQDTEPV